MSDGTALMTINQDNTLTKLTELTKMLIEQYSNQQQIISKYIETSNLSIEDYDSGSTPDVYFIQDQKEYLKNLSDESNYNNFKFEKICNQLDIVVPTEKSLIVPNEKRKSFYPRFKIHCAYEGQCDNCEDGALHEKDIGNYCVDICETCIVFRKLDKKMVIEKAKEIYHTQIQPARSGSLTPKNMTKTNITNITINNMYVNCDSLEINIQQPFFTTADNIFYIIIEIKRETLEETIKKLKYIFINLMCGVNGKLLFPKEEKHSLSSTFSVSAALYTIKDAKIKPILHGLIRYKKEGTSVMTLTKLHNIGKSTNISKCPIISASLMPLWENKKQHYCMKSFNETVKYITSSSYYGSPIKSFM